MFTQWDKIIPVRSQHYPNLNLFKNRHDESARQ